MKKKKLKKWVIVVAILLLIGGGFAFLYYQRLETEKKLAQQEKLQKEIQNHFAKQVEITKDAIIYSKNKSKYQKIGEIGKGEIVSLKNQKITYQTKYFYIPKLNAYIPYQNCKKTDQKIVQNHRYQKYLQFNENIISKEGVHLYRGKSLAYILSSSITEPIIQKEENGYYIEYFDELFFVPKEDVLKTETVQNTTEEEASEVPVTVYHFIYLPGDNSCNEAICHPQSQIEEQFQYLKDQSYFTLTTTELRLFLEGKIRLPKKSILVTIDDGARAEHFIPLLEKYQVNATLFLISSWYPTDKFKSDYLELASHTHNLHTPGVCPGGQGSPLKCYDKEKLVADLKLSRQTLNQTEAFCFPFYEYNDYGIEAIKEAGFKLGFIGGMRKANKNTNPYTVPRISMNRNTTLEEYKNYIN